MLVSTLLLACCHILLVGIETGIGGVMTEISSNSLAQTQAASQTVTIERSQQTDTETRAEQQRETEQALAESQNLSISAVKENSEVEVSEDPLESAQQEIQQSAGTATLVQANQSVEAVVQLVS